MKKIAISVSYGGFGLSDAAKELLKSLVAATGEPGRDVKRDDPILIQVIEQLGSEAASGEHSELMVVEIPDNVEWQIDEYDGLEWVAEKHRVWGKE